jgi:hypothetical protein
MHHSYFEQRSPREFDEDANLKSHFFGSETENLETTFHDVSYDGLINDKGGKLNPLHEMSTEVNSNDEGCIEVPKKKRRYEWQKVRKVSFSHLFYI